MKKSVILILSIVFTANIYAQRNEKADTLIAKTVVPGPWAIEFELGASTNQVLQSSYADNPIAFTFNYKVFYQNFFMHLGTKMSEFNTSKDMRFTNFVINKQDQVSLMNMNMSIGYMYSFNKKWSADAMIGVSMNNLQITYNNKLNSYSPDISQGTYFGLGLNRYFKLKRYNYIVLSLGADYSTTNFSKISPDMTTPSINYSFTVAYKGFSKKVIN